MVMYEQNNVNTILNTNILLTVLIEIDAINVFSFENQSYDIEL